MWIDRSSAHGTFRTWAALTAHLQNALLTTADASIDRALLKPKVEGHHGTVLADMVRAWSLGLAARHKVDPPRHDQHHPDAFWRAAVMLEECVVLRPLPARNELYSFGVAVAYLGIHGERVSTKFEA
jgi:hypothetical protein